MTKVTLALVAKKNENKSKIKLAKKCQDNKTVIVMFKKITTFLNFKTRFDVANIIVGCKIFEKPLGVYNN